MLKLRSNPDNILEIEHFVSEIIQKYGINPDMHPNILISLTEAVNNAIRHGNNSDESKFVCVDLKKKKNILTLWVQDEGCGFNVTTVPDPTVPENVEKLGGRGVFIMQQLCDKLCYKENGRVVELHFELSNA